MSGLDVAFLRYLMLELLRRYPEGLSLADLVRRIGAHDRARRLGRIFQAARECRDIVESEAHRGVYVLSLAGRAALARITGYTLPADIEAQIPREPERQSPQANQGHEKPPPRQPAEGRSEPKPGSRTAQIVAVLHEAGRPLTRKEIGERLGWDKSEGALSGCIWWARRYGYVELASSTRPHRYRLPARDGVPRLVPAAQTAPAEREAPPVEDVQLHDVEQQLRETIRQLQALHQAIGSLRR